MAIEIEAVKKEVKKIVRTTQNTPDEPLEYLLVPYNDPFVESGIIRHTNAESFINDVDNLEATGGDDTPEPLIEAMHAATIRCPPRSTVFVFTDAPDSNNEKIEEVLAMIIAKRIEVNIYLTEPSLRQLVSNFVSCSVVPSRPLSTSRSFFENHKKYLGLTRTSKTCSNLWWYDLQDHQRH